MVYVLNFWITIWCIYHFSHVYYISRLILSVLDLISIIKFWIQFFFIYLMIQQINGQLNNQYQ